MTTPEQPVTPATRALDAAGVPYRMVHYGRVASAEEAAERRGVSLAALAKTLVVRVEEGSYVLVLVPGDRGLDYAKLRARLGVRRLTMPDPEEARAATGYERGTITPVGAGGHPVILDQRLAALDEISLGSGVHGWAIHLAPGRLGDLGASVADIARQE
ncbi:MAG TPA: aminoacyl-tRNA deacylase [Acidimicrobiia bacterium]|nr:aminoacyl-tRNA deacylase [Acidimicrobiia bacterium]